MQSTRLASAFNVISAIVTLLVQMAVSFFLSSFLVATVGEAANGFTQLANNFVSYASLVTLAFNSMGSRFISSAYHRGKVQDAVSYYSTLIVCNAILCVLFVPVALSILTNLGSIVDMGNADQGDVVVLFAFVFANFGVNLFVSLFCAAMFVVNKVYIQNAVNLCRNVLNALILVALYAVLETRVSYVSITSFALTLLSIPLCYWLKCRLVPEMKFSFKAFSMKFVKSLTSSGIWNTVNQCGNILTTGLDLLFANWFVGASPMGVLSVAKTVPSAITSLASALNNNLEPELVIIYAKEGLEGLRRRLMLDIHLSNYIISIPIGVCCVLFPAFYALWMPSLDPVELSVLSILTVGVYALTSGTQVCYNAFTVLNRLKVNSLAFVAGSVLNVLLVLALLCFTDLGVFAIAGMSTFISIARNTAITAPYVSSLLKMPWWSFYPEMGRSLLCVSLSVGVSVAVTFVIPTSSWFSLFLAAVLSCLLSWVFSFAIGFPSPERARYLTFVRERLHIL